MKRCLLLCMIVLASLIRLCAQEPTITVVKLKNGTAVTGIAKEFIPAEKIVLNVGGLETTISMNDVDSIFSQQTVPAPSAMPKETPSPKALPKETTFNICGVDVPFVLMQGGSFLYGFDGRGSLSMNSEPVHSVFLSPFYVSKEFVTRELYKAVMKRAFPARFAINYKSKKYDSEQLQKYAFFVSDKLGRRSLRTIYPDSTSKVKRSSISVESFLEKVRSSLADTAIDIPTEVEWFYCENKLGKEARSLETPPLIYCQFVRLVSMSELNNPVGTTIVVKGATNHKDKDEVEQYRLYDREAPEMTNISGPYWEISNNKTGKGRMDNFSVHKKLDPAGDVPLCPVRLVIPVNE